MQRYGTPVLVQGTKIETQAGKEKYVHATRFIRFCAFMGFLLLIFRLVPLLV